MAPEAITHPDEVGPATDIYALGAVGYFLVSGREPFAGSSAVEVCSKHLHVEPEPPATDGGERVDPGLEALILRSLAKAPADRPPDGAALAAALDGLGLDGWTDADASRWWRVHRDDAKRPATQATPTQLAIDLAGR
jgi:serine/threonine-protein kinase